MKKSLITLSVVGAVALSLAACGGRKNTNNTVAKTPTSQGAKDGSGGAGDTGDTDGSTSVPPLTQGEGLAVLEAVLGRLNPEIAKKSTLFDKYKENFESAASQELLTKVSSTNFTLDSVKEEVTEGKDDIKTSSLLLVGEDEKVLKFKYELNENAKVSREAFLTGKTPELKVVNTESTDNKMRIFAGCVKDCTQVGVIGYFPDEKGASQYFGLVFQLNATNQYDLIFTTHKTKKIEEYKKAGVTSKCDAAKDISCAVAEQTEETCQTNPSPEQCRVLLGGETSEKYKNAVASFCSDDSKKAEDICKAVTTTTTPPADEQTGDGADQGAGAGTGDETENTGNNPSGCSAADVGTPKCLPKPTEAQCLENPSRFRCDEVLGDVNSDKFKQAVSQYCAVATNKQADICKPATTTTDTNTTTTTPPSEDFDFSKLTKTEQLQQCDDNIMSYSQCQTLGGVNNETGAQQSYSLEVKEQCGTSDPSNMTDEQVKNCDAALLKIDKAMYDAKMKAKQSQKTSQAPAAAQAAKSDAFLGRDTYMNSAGGR